MMRIQETTLLSLALLSNRFCLSKNKIKIYVAVFLLTLFTACQKEDIEVDTIAQLDFGGQVSKIETLGYYSAAEAIVVLQIANPQAKVETTNGYYLYRITYKSTNFDGTPILVSGLMAVPNTKNIKGVVSYHHGTIPDRKTAPSNPTLANPEGLAISSVFAANGYILLAADYIGLGLSNEVPTYLHTPSTVNTIIDFIKVGSTVVKNLTKGKNSNLFLVGFSQGGSATVGVHRQLEINNPTGLTLKASASIAGAYNLKEITLPYAIQNNSIGYLAYVANAYAHIYAQPLSTIIKEEFVDVIPSLFNGSKDWDEIEEKLPKKVEDLYKQSMLEAIQHGRSNWFTDALAENETYQWKPGIKMKMFYGTKDKDVSPQDAVAAYNYMKGLGGNVELINLGDYDHVETALHALPEVQKWFNQIK